MKAFLLVFLVFWSISGYSYRGNMPQRPDSRFSYPSYCQAEYPEFREIRYRQDVVVCHRKVSRGLKDRIYDNYKIPESKRGEYTIDHLVPLSLGGSNGIENLWPQHRSLSTAQLEFQVFLKVRDGELSIFEAHNIILKAKYD